MHYTTVKMPGFGPRQAAFLDIPIGDPFGGPAYGQKEKSKGIGIVIGVVAGAMTAGAGYMAWAAAAASSTGMTLGAGLAAGAMMAGGTMTAVGALTGNKKLSRIGGVLSLAGGLGGSFVNVTDAAGNSLGNLTEVGSKGMMDKVSSSFSSASESLGFTSEASKTAASAASTGSDLASTGGNIGLESSANSGLVEGAMNSSSQGAQSTTGLAAGSSVTDPGFSNGVTNQIGGISQASQQASGTVGAGLQGAATSPLNAPAAGAAVTPPPAGGGILDNAMKFAQSPGGGQLISGGIKAVGDGFAGSAQEDQLQKQYDLYAQKLGADQAQVELKNNNMNAKFEFLDPNDPQLAQKKQQAIANGSIPITFGVNQNAGPVTSNGVTMQANQIQQPKPVGA